MSLPDHLNLSSHLIVPDWPAPQNVRALQTTRVGGFGSAPYDSFNLGDHVGDVPLVVARNRMSLNTLLPSEPVWLKQVHGTVVVDTATSGCGAPEADASISRHAGSVCVVMTADCLPVLLCDTQGSVVGAAHAGWKGLEAGVIEATVQAMKVVPRNLMAWLGPAISQPAFEVGEEVRTLFVDADPHAAAAFIPGQNGKWQADLYALARLRLNVLGVTQIYGGGDCDTLLRSSRLREQSPAAPPAPDGSTAPCRDGYCTYREPERFFSYRRDGVTGRMGTFIWIAR
ncbi:MAG: peptidoglycan editing factor PgeF [Nitrosomonadales bacterium]|nr:peptidoglycan editing factor PgeF [Nitrosomonadales bacterium]